MKHPFKVDITISLEFITSLSALFSSRYHLREACSRIPSALEKYEKKTKKQNTCKEQLNYLQFYSFKGPQRCAKGNRKHNYLNGRLRCMPFVTQAPLNSQINSARRLCPQPWSGSPPSPLLSADDHNELL